MEELTASIDKFAERAEASGNLTWIAKYNSLKCTALQKKELGFIQDYLNRCAGALKSS